MSTDNQTASDSNIVLGTGALTCSGVDLGREGGSHGGQPPSPFGLDPEIFNSLATIVQFARIQGNIAERTLKMFQLNPVCSG